MQLLPMLLLLQEALLGLASSLGVFMELHQGLQDLQGTMQTEERGLQNLQQLQQQPEASAPPGSLAGRLLQPKTPRPHLAQQ